MKIFDKILTLTAVVLLCASCNNNYNTQGNEELKAKENSNGRNDEWGFIGPGGGGAMFNSSINPSDPDHVFVSCDMTGSYVTYDGGKRWRMFNLRGDTQYFVFDPNNPDIVYSSTPTMLFKSTDRGNSWHTLYPRPEDIVAINLQGDHGWETVVTKDSTITTVRKFAIDPKDSQKMFLLIQVNEEEKWPVIEETKGKAFGVLLVSEDAGEHWTEEKKLDFAAEGFFLNPASNIFIDPTSPETNRTIYITDLKSIQVRRDGHWRMANLPEKAGLITQYVDGFDTKVNQHIIYAISGKSHFNQNGSEKYSRIYKTNDGGKNWIRLEKGLVQKKTNGAADPEFTSLAVSYYHPENIYISYAKLRFSKDSTSIGVAKSADYGETWDIVWQDKFTMNRSIPSPNRESGWLDERFGPEWGENPFHIKVADHNPSICYATDYGRTIKTTDGGLTWQQIYTTKVPGGGWKSRGLQVTTGYMLAFDPFDSLHVFMADTDTGLMESFDGGNSWSSATNNNGVPAVWVNTTYWLVFDPEIKDKVWAVMSRNHDLPRPKMWRHLKMEDYKGGVLVSDNGGKTWQPISKDIGETAPTHIIIDPESDLKNRTLYVCAFGKGVYKSENGGTSWQQKNNGIEGKQPAAWRITQRIDGALFLIVSRTSEDGSIGNEKDGALYRSTDGAETWVKMNLPKGVNGPTSLMIDPDNPNRLLLSAWGRYGETKFSPNQGGGIYLSEDNGTSWIQTLKHDQHIHDITSDMRNGVFYAAGFNSSAYRSEDKGQTWNRIKGYNFKWGKRVQPDPKDPEKVYIITFGGGVWHGPAKGDENALEDIVTSQTSYK